MREPTSRTTVFRYGSNDRSESIRRTLQEVYEALQEKGYNPVGQIVGYLMSGDPTFITSHRNARNILASIERDVILEELIHFYLEQHQ